ncbi:MAG: alanine--tRNA ligase [Saprospiraceae bacterium]|nr:alanine--tRNA ligase [Saprospiraceae bacterium]
MTSREIRQTFLDFFKSKAHKIVPSAPIVNKTDPTLMFTNSGMNQFKDYFLGNQVPDIRRIADTQKCLRVSGKHNDLEEVGRDSYHQTMFEMLGNWSFGDYFKEEAIAWAWELLTEVYGLPKDRIYVSVFKGDVEDNLPADDEAAALWKKWVSEDRILYFDKKDNFWEMGDTGPCGPCSEIHVDLRSEADRELVSGKSLVNQDHPQVIEIWNLVFIQFNRKADGSLEELPEKHIDTGMGFERLSMAIQAKSSNYDTDVFSPFIAFIEEASGIPYTSKYEESAKSDIAMRVVADHVRAVAFAVADGQLPGNSGAGYVIRRILRRAVRYYYSFLDIKSPFLHRLIPMLATHFGDVFPELQAQEAQVARIIEAEERAFLQTLENGLRRFDQLEVADGVISGSDAFELYDTFGFPIDLTRLIAAEKGYEVDEAGFEQALQVQKARSRADAKKEVGDWMLVQEGESVFVGYDVLEVPETRVLKYREVQQKKSVQVQVVLAETPFYGESGGQHGDTGTLWFGSEQLQVKDTLKENDLTVHILDRMPTQPEASVRAIVDAPKRMATSQNHTAAHLMHAALHKILGTHALQKGQDVDDRRLRFDFSHFQKVTAEELTAIEAMVNEKISANIPLQEDRAIPVEAARAAGATMLFGEKYGDLVRMITFDPAFSRELCGGTHVAATGSLGLFKIVSESAVAAGIRRIEAITSDTARQHVQQAMDQLDEIREVLKQPKDLVQSIQALQQENRQLRRKMEQLMQDKAQELKGALLQSVQKMGDVAFIRAAVELDDANVLKGLVFQLDQALENAVVVLGAVVDDKPQLVVSVSKSLAAGGSGLNAAQLVKTLATSIKGGGGGQAFFATAGGSDATGLKQAIERAEEVLQAALASR